MAAWRANPLSSINEPDYPGQDQPVIRIESLEFAYRHSGFRLRVPTLVVAPGEKVALIGPAGSGKSTLLNLVAGNLTADAGSVTVDQEPMGALDERARRYLRVTTLGLIFQDLALLDYLSVMDNILLPYRLSRVLTLDNGVRTRADALARGMGLGARLDSPVGELCHGERRCVSLCRALLPKPRLILADDPVAGLDPGGRAQVLSLLLRSAEVYEATVVASIHDHELLGRFDRTVDCGLFQAGDQA